MEPVNYHFIRFSELDSDASLYAGQTCSTVNQNGRRTCLQSLCVELMESIMETPNITLSPSLVVGKVGTSRRRGTIRML